MLLCFADNRKFNLKSTDMKKIRKLFVEDRHNLPKTVNKTKIA